MQYYMDFSVILGAATLVCGAIWLIYALFFSKGRTKEPKLVENARSFFPIFLFVFILRAFLFEPFRIPTGSMKPSLLEGDFILVNKYSYGLRLPLIAKKFLSINEPERGDVLVFRFPVNPSMDLIKRVIALPGDKVAYKDKVVYLNGEPLKQAYVRTTLDTNPGTPSFQATQFKETIGKKEHAIFLNERSDQDMPEQVVPQGMYFVMGDNRDSSDDSRSWGFVPEKLILGKAIYVWLSLDIPKWQVRWDRLVKRIE